MNTNDYRLTAPPVLRDFLVYHETIQGHSRKTVDEYYLDLRNFFRYVKIEKGKAPRTAELDEIPIDDVDLDLARSVTLSDVYSYMNYLSRDRAKHANSPSTGYGLEATARARKIAAIRSFYKYLTSKAKLISENPMQDLDSPRLKKSLPRYLSLDESIQLLEAVADPNALFLTRTHTRMTKDAVHYMVKQRLKKAGLDASLYSSHKLRHTAATLMLQNGVDVRTLQEVLGHENLNTTQIYTHVDNENLRSAAKANPLGRMKKKSTPIPPGK